jgi:UDP-N-acetylmuramoylalanine-D-glutamate ligase
LQNAGKKEKKMEFSGKKVTVVGTGISGIGAVGLLNAVGAEVVLYDGNEKLKIEDIEKKLGTYKAEIVLGELTINGQFGFTGYQSGCAD